MTGNATVPPGPKGSQVTLLDVARMAQVDRSVVSRVINNDPRLAVRAETRERVLRAIRDLGYHPNAAARSLRTAQADAIGLIIPDFANPIYAEIIKGAEQAAREVGSVLLTGSIDRGAAAGNYLQLLASGRVDGLLVAAPGDQLPARLVEPAVSTGRPLIWLNQKGTGPARAILLDDEAAAGLATRHLLELGHTSIGHITGPVGVDTAQRRRRGFVRAMAAAQISVPDEYVLATDYTVEGGEAAMRALLELDNPPTAVFVANVASAIGALRAARETATTVPGDLSLVAVHDIPLADDLRPPLTTVRMPLRELGRAGVLALADKRLRPRTKVVREPMELIVRETTAPPSPR